MGRCSLFRLLFCFYFLFLLESCAALKKREHQPAVLSSAPTPSSIATSHFEKGNWPAYNWWEMFADPQLSEMMEKAIENNPDLLAAVSRLASARARAEKMRAPLLPHLSASASDNYQHLSKDELVRYPPSVVPPVVNEVHLALNFDYEIDLFGKNRNLYYAALDETRAQAAEMSQSLLMITTRLAESYVNYGASLVHLQMSRDLREMQKGLFELTKLRYENGLEDERGVEEAAAELFEREKEVLGFEKEVEVERSTLKILMGLGPDDPIEIDPPTLSFDNPFPLPDDIPLNLLARRPDLMAQIWTVEAMAHKIKGAKGAFFPNINLKAFVGLQSLHWSSLFSIDSFAGALSPAINLPLFQGGALKGALHESYANYDEAVYAYNALVLKAAKEVTDQMTLFEKTTEQAKKETETFFAKKRSADLLIKRYENGIDDYLAVLKSQIGLMEEAQVEVGVQNNRYISVLMLIKALGGGYGQHSIYEEKK